MGFVDIYTLYVCIYQLLNKIGCRSVKEEQKDGRNCFLEGSYKYVLLYRSKGEPKLHPWLFSWKTTSVNVQDLVSPFCPFCHVAHLCSVCVHFYSAHF